MESETFICMTDVQSSMGVDVKWRSEDFILHDPARGLTFTRPIFPLCRSWVKCHYGGHRLSRPLLFWRVSLYPDFVPDELHKNV